ncbi:MAG: type II toxin-antitoxin system VapC family toxin [Kiritimatiellae bacterium]|nr:type II toxin-antitoxin system VapC family toxin [Kiritimatiellia bacterium]MDD4736164.1 type II toxin-antitoxin system VapC family toxin [Kiritimatiellia bacterium]
MSTEKADKRYVLDSFALLAYLGDEVGADAVRRVLEKSAGREDSVFLSVINYGECLYIIERERGVKEAHKAIAAIGQLPVCLVPAGMDETLEAAHIKANCKVSYADAFAIGLARMKGATVVTGDREFHAVEGLVDILWLKR